MTQIGGSAQFTSLGQPGYALRAPGLVGQAELRQPVPAASRGLRGGMDAALPALESALAASGVVTVREIDLELQPAPGGAGRSRALRGPDEVESVELEVPDPGPDYGQVVMSVDDAGAIRWHLPLPATAASQGVSRGQGGTQRFRIPATLPPPPAADTAGSQRSVFGMVARRLLKVLVYPWSDPLVGWAIDTYVASWEARKRPYRLRRFTPGDYTAAGGDGVDTADLAQMAQAGPVLLFVHGTFSSAHAAFGELPPPVFAELHRRYDGRVIAFDHPTLSETPDANVAWLLRQLPPQRLRVDIVCHSRGGLVSRLLAERTPASSLDVGKVVLAGVPNAGTLLSDPAHMGDMIDRLTTALSLSPAGPVSETMEALVTVVKVLGRGLLTGLDGLAAMKPDGTFLRALNAAEVGAGDYHAIAADYRATDRGLRGLVAGAADNVMDLVFGNAPNDLVVPFEGVFGANGGRNFPIEPERLLLLKDPTPAMHTRMFGQPEVGQRLLQWLR